MTLLEELFERRLRAIAIVKKRQWLEIAAYRALVNRWVPFECSGSRNNDLSCNNSVTVFALRS